MQADDPRLGQAEGRGGLDDPGVRGPVEASWPGTPVGRGLDGEDGSG